MIDLDQKNLFNSAKRSNLDPEISYKDLSMMGEDRDKKKTFRNGKHSISAKKLDEDDIHYESDSISDIIMRFSKTFKRGPYRKYSQKLKQEAVSMAMRLNDPNKAASVYKIPVKNLRRWIRLGTEKKKGWLIRW